MSRHAGCVVLMSWLLAGPVFAGSIEGQVVMASLVEGESKARPGQAVIWVEAIPEKTERDLARGPKHGLFGKRHPRATPVIAQKDGRFDPRVVTVVAGRTLIIRNDDKVWHGVFSVSKPGAFDLGKRKPGQVDSVRFEAAGIVALRCDLHPDESAFVVVTPNHASVQASAEGQWRLPDLPGGKYVVHAWAPGRTELRRDVELGKKSAVKLSLRW